MTSLVAVEDGERAPLELREWEDGRINKHEADIYLG